MAAHNELGKNGEQLAQNYLINKGYFIRETNWRFQRAEIDIIAQKGDLLAVIEVKTRSHRFFGEPQEFVKKQKIQMLTKAIDHYVISHDLEVEVRFDIIGIIKRENKSSITHLEDAFYHY